MYAYECTSLYIYLQSLTSSAVCFLQFNVTYQKIVIKQSLHTAVPPPHPILTFIT